MRQNHKLFATYPLDGKVQLGSESLTSPYHIYDGEILFIGGRANGKVAAELLRNEGLTPILDQNGNALAAAWVCNFTEANLGAHHELQFSIFASFQPQAPVAPHPLAIYRLLTLNPQTMMVCHGLWNSTERVVRYNREHLLLDARLCTSTIAVDEAGQEWRFDYSDTESQQTLLTGRIHVPRQQPFKVIWEMTRHLGFGGMMKSARDAFIHVPVVNTRSALSAQNLLAHTYTKADGQKIFWYDESQQLTIAHPEYSALAFAPDFVQCSEGVRFVFLRPEASGV